MPLKAAAVALTILTPVFDASASHAQTVGFCRFDIAKASFPGSKSAQAACLLRKVEPLGHVAPVPATLPSRLAGLLSGAPPLDRSRLTELIARKGLDEAVLGGRLDTPLSRGSDNSPTAPSARYFVIHDTSTPNFGAAPFPTDTDTGGAVNRLARYHRADPVAHVFVNRLGDTWVGHDFRVPWRATKLEKTIGVRSKGLFLHIELVQPRRAHPHQADGTAPTPGFTSAQYDKLAMLYLAASVRAGAALVPAFHAVLDTGLNDGHDDPRNFDLAAFDAALGRALDAMK